jgi:hypothetical protein
MKILLRGGPCDGQPDTVPESCRSLSLGGRPGFYRPTNETTTDGSQIWDFDDALMRREQFKQFRNLQGSDQC